MGTRKKGNSERVMMGNCGEHFTACQVLLSILHALSRSILTKAWWGRHSGCPHFTDKETGKERLTDLSRPQPLDVWSHAVWVMDVWAIVELLLAAL